MRLKIPPKVKYILDCLRSHGFDAYCVGGCVRDAVLARDPHDWDITTSARPEEVKACFRKTIDTGIQHGTVTVMVDSEGFEVTTYRIDGEYSDGRHPDNVSFTSDLAEDLKRRDFTINAMAYNEQEGLVDLFGGMQDLQKKIIRCVGDPDERFDEDALRIMRAVRFAAQLGFEIDPATRQAISGHAEHLRMVSAERIREEAMKLLTSPHPEKWMDLYELGITAVILPEFDVCMNTPQNTPYHIYNVGEHIVKSMCEIRNDKVLRLTMLLHDIGKPRVRWTDSTGQDHFKGHAYVSADMADDILRRWKFDNDTRKRVVNLIRWHDLRPKPTEKDVRRCIYTVGTDQFEDYLAVQWADNLAKSNYKLKEHQERLKEVYRIYQQIIKKDECLSLQDLKIGGSDLMAIGIHGRLIGVILDSALLAVLADQRLNDREILLIYAREVQKRYGE